jgi:hypothetical protein
VVEYTPAEIKRAVVGYGRADKHQVQQMIKLLLGLPKAPAPHDAADALAVAICHLHSGPWGRPRRSGAEAGQVRLSEPDKARSTRPDARSWRQYRPPAHG